MHVMTSHPDEREHTMTQRKSTPGRTDLKALAADDQDFLRQIVRVAVQQFLEAEMTDASGAGPGERTEDRLGYRTGHYPRTLITRVGTLELRVPGPARPLLHGDLRTLPTLREGLGVCARRDVRAGCLHVQGQGRQRGVVRA